MAANSLEKFMCDPDLVRQPTASEIMQPMKTLQQLLFNRRLSYANSLQTAASFLPCEKEHWAMNIDPNIIFDSWGATLSTRDPLQTVGASPPRVREIAPMNNYVSRLHCLWNPFLNRQDRHQPIMDSSQAVGAEGAADLEIEAMELIKWLVLALSQPRTFLPPRSQGAATIGNVTDLEMPMMTLVQLLQSAVNRSRSNRIVGAEYQGYQSIVELKVMALVQSLQSALNQLQSNQESSQARGPSQTTDAGASANNLEVGALMNNLAGLSTESNGAAF